MIGIAWIDGRLEQEEVNALKELLFLLPDISGEDWMQLELYMTHVVSDAERQDLLDRVLSGIRSSRDKQLVLETLEKLVAGDGADRATESAFLEHIRQDIEGHSTGLLGHLTAPFRQALKRKAGQYQGAREDRIEDFIKNSDLFPIDVGVAAPGTHPFDPGDGGPENLFGGGPDGPRGMGGQRGVSPRTGGHEPGAPTTLERARRRSPVGHRDESQPDHARPGSRSAHQGFCHYTTIEERKAFLRCLFAIANAAEDTSHAEIEAIRQIATSFELPHQEFIEAKLTIPRQDRAGL